MMIHCLKSAVGSSESDIAGGAVLTVGGSADDEDNSVGGEGFVCVRCVSVREP